MPNTTTRKLTALSVVALLAATTSCTSTSYTDNGVTFKRVSLFNQAKIGKLEKTKDGLLLEGYANDQIEGMKAVVGAAVEGAVKGAKGMP